jgi:hypothetical protein
MGTIYVASDDGLLVVEGARAERKLEGREAYCVACEQATAGRVLLGWKSRSLGQAARW